jgi:NTP pyrophosphatase (non-canonical NTP hydrolase)
MQANTYQEEMKKFISSIPCKPEQSTLITSALGLTGEAGEYADLIKKVVFHGKELDREHAIKELGDVCWYIALACHALGVNFEDVLQTNIDKLSARYSSGHFTVEEANNRKEGDI